MPDNRPGWLSQSGREMRRGETGGALPGMPIPASYRSTAMVAATPAAADSIEISA